MANASIRVGQSSKITIEVNDSGDCIEINPDDKRFSLKLNDFVRNVKTLLSDAENETKKYAALGNNATEDDILSALEYDAKISEKVSVWVDDLFGAGTCAKAFGEGTIPSLDSVVEFYNQITPYIQKAVQSRRAAVNKRYSPRRNGGV